MPRKTLKDRHRIFIAEYMRDWNASAAMLRAGYASANPHVDGPKLLATPRIRAEIERRIKSREVRYEVSAAKVIKEMARIAFADLRDFAEFDDDGKLKPFNLRLLPDDVTAAIVEISEDKDGRVRFKLGDKVASLRDLGKHLGLYSKKLEITGKVTLEDLVLEGLRTAAAAQKAKGNGLDDHTTH